MEETAPYRIRAVEEMKRGGSSISADPLHHTKVNPLYIDPTSLSNAQRNILLVALAAMAADPKGSQNFDDLFRQLSQDVSLNTQRLLMSLADELWQRAPSRG